MKFLLAPLAVASLAFSMSACSETIDTKSPELVKVGYSFGYSMGNDSKKALDDLDIDAFTQGLKDAYADKEGALTKDEMQKVLMEYQTKKQQEQLADMKKKAEENLETGKKWLAENAKKDGVITTKSGLQYKQVKAGTGASPKKTDTVKVHYEGRLLDGTVFDSSLKRGEPVTFRLNQVIPGWTEGLQLMKEDSSYQLYIPADLAYGERGTPGDIAPNSMLIFDVQLLEVNPK